MNKVWAQQYALFENALGAYQLQLETDAEDHNATRTKMALLDEAVKNILMMPPADMEQILMKYQALRFSGLDLQFGPEKVFAIIEGDMKVILNKHSYGEVTKYSVCN